jgi:hypothetical protein
VNTVHDGLIDAFVTALYETVDAAERGVASAGDRSAIGRYGTIE